MECSENFFHAKGTPSRTMKSHQCLLLALTLLRQMQALQGSEPSLVAGAVHYHGLHLSSAFTRGSFSLERRSSARRTIWVGEGPVRGDRSAVGEGSTIEDDPPPLAMEPRTVCCAICAKAAHKPGVARSGCCLFLENSKKDILEKKCKKKWN